MRGFILAVIVVLPMMLSGCAGDRQQQRFEDFRSELCAGTPEATAVVTAEAEGALREYTLWASPEGDGARVVCLAPELIAGVTVLLSRDGTEIGFGDVVLEAPALSPGLTPLNALPLVLDALANAHTDMLWLEEGRLAARLIPSDTLIVTVWFDGDAVPEHAEIYDAESGTMLIRCEIEEFTVR